MPNTQFRWDATVPDLQAETGMVNGEVAVLQGEVSRGDGGNRALYFDTTIPASATVTAATNATPIVIGTAAPHGLGTGRQVTVAGAGGTNTAANTTRAIWVLGIVANAAGTSTVTITSLGHHGLVTNDVVRIGNVQGFSGANGQFTVTVVTPQKFTLNGATGSGTFSKGGVFTKLDAAKLSGATNQAPIAITTAAAHALTTGQQVTISGVLGNTAANGTRTIVVTSPTTFTLTGSDGTASGAYTANTGLVYATSGMISTAAGAPVVITTTAAHGLSTGQVVTIEGVTNNENAFGTWTITVTSSTTFKLEGATSYASGSGGVVITPTTFALEGATGNGSYTSGGAVGDGASVIPSNNGAGLWRRLS
jgi:hypothetical protein